MLWSESLMLRKYLWTWDDRGTSNHASWTCGCCDGPICHLFILASLPSSEALTLELEMVDMAVKKGRSDQQLFGSHGHLLRSGRSVRCHQDSPTRATSPGQMGRWIWTQAGSLCHEHLSVHLSETEQTPGAQAKWFPSPKTSKRSKTIQNVNLRPSEVVEFQLPLQCYNKIQ